MLDHREDTERIARRAKSKVFDTLGDAAEAEANGYGDSLPAETITYLSGLTADIRRNGYVRGERIA